MPAKADIGGENEDEANAEAGSIIKKFEKSNPKEEEMMYEGINNKIKLLNESILLTEKLNIRDNFLAISISVSSMFLITN